MLLKVSIYHDPVSFLLVKSTGPDFRRGDDLAATSKTFVCYPLKPRGLNAYRFKGLLERLNNLANSLDIRKCQTVVNRQSQYAVCCPAGYGQRPVYCNAAVT